MKTIELIEGPIKLQSILVDPVIWAAGFDEFERNFKDIERSISNSTLTYMNTLISSVILEETPESLNKTQLIADHLLGEYTSILGRIEKINPQQKTGPKLFPTWFDSVVIPINSFNKIHLAIYGSIFLLKSLLREIEKYNPVKEENITNIDEIKSVYRWLKDKEVIFESENSFVSLFSNEPQNPVYWAGKVTDAWRFYCYLTGKTREEVRPKEMEIRFKLSKGKQFDSGNKPKENDMNKGLLDDYKNEKMKK